MCNTCVVGRVQWSREGEGEGGSRGVYLYLFNLFPTSYFRSAFILWCTHSFYGVRIVGQWSMPRSAWQTPSPRGLALRCASVRKGELQDFTSNDFYAWSKKPEVVMAGCVCVVRGKRRRRRRAQENGPEIAYNQAQAKTTWRRSGRAR